MSFTGKVILVTGANSGIGADAARHLAGLGGKLALVGRNADRLNETAEQIRAANAPEPLVIVADVTTDAERIVTETVNHFGQLDVLVNNAGIMQIESVPTIDMDNFAKMMDTNVYALVRLTQAAVPHLEKTKGNVLNVSSSVSLRREDSVSSYTITKAAVDQLTKSAAMDLASRRIRVNSINPVVVRTPLFENSGVVTAATADDFYKTYASIYPLGRVGEVSDTSNAIEFLTKDSSNFLTGIILAVDGGRVSQ